MNDKQILLNKIVQHLILYTSSLSDLGLLSGKMGVCIFFYRYARHTGITRYADFAGELLDEIYAEINTGITKDFGSGLAGICWGIEYLTREGFVEADADEILCDMDPLIQERDMRKITDTSLETGLEGLAHYVLARCSNKPTPSIENLYISELKGNVESKGCCPDLAPKLGSLLMGVHVDYTFDLIVGIASRSSISKKSPFKGAKLGMSGNGLAGVGLRLVNKSVK